MKRLTVVFLLAVGALCGQVAREQCFPIEDLNAADREAAQKLFLKIMDGEGLYTVIGGLKPMSSGFVNFRAATAALETPALDDARRLLERFRCGGDVFATIQHFGRAYPNSQNKELERPYEGVLFHVPAMQTVLTAKRAVFAPLGLTPHSHPMEALMAVEYQENPLRLKGLGYFYGYPDYAIDFFYSAAREQDMTGKFVERDFVSLPTHERAERGVVYAVPKGHQEVEADRRFRERILATLSAYRTRRERYVGEGKPGIVELLRDWFCAGAVCTVSRAAAE